MKICKEKDSWAGDLDRLSDGELERFIAHTSHCKYHNDILINYENSFRTYISAAFELSDEDKLLAIGAMPEMFSALKTERLPCFVFPEMNADSLREETGVVKRRGKRYGPDIFLNTDRRVHFINHKAIGPILTLILAALSLWVVLDATRIKHDIISTAYYLNRDSVFEMPGTAVPLKENPVFAKQKTAFSSRFRSVQTPRSENDPGNTTPTVGTGGPFGGPTGLFTIYDGQILRRGEYTLSVAYSNFGRDTRDPNQSEGASLVFANLPTYLPDAPFITEFSNFNELQRGATIFATAPLSELFFKKRHFTQFSRVGMTYQFSASTIEDPPVDRDFNSQQAIPVFGFRILAGTIGSFAVSDQMRNGNSLAFVSGVPIYERYFLGSVQDIRGYDIRSISPAALNTYLTTRNGVATLNQTGTLVVPGLSARDREELAAFDTFASFSGINPALISRAFIYTGGDTQLLGNFEYRIPVFGPASLAVFADIGSVFNLRNDDVQKINSNFLPDQPFGIFTVGRRWIWSGSDTPAASISPFPRFYAGQMDNFARFYQLQRGASPGDSKKEQKSILTQNEYRYNEHHFLVLDFAYHLNGNGQGSEFSRGNSKKSAAASFPSLDKNNLQKLRDIFPFSADQDHVIFPATIGRRSNTGASSATGNKPPDVYSLRMSDSEVILGCSAGYTSRTGGVRKSAVDVSVMATGPENGALIYKYAVTGGRIVGQGASVSWDLSDAEPGIYTITVSADDGRGILGKTKTRTVTVSRCANCVKIADSFTMEMQFDKPYDIKTMKKKPSW